MSPVLATISHHTSLQIAEVAFLLIVIAGVWIVAAELLPQRFHTVRLVVAGGAFAAAGVLLIIATHWGQFG